MGVKEGHRVLNGFRVSIQILQPGNLNLNLISILETYARVKGEGQVGGCHAVVLHWFVHGNGWGIALPSLHIGEDNFYIPCLILLGIQKQ